MPCCRAVALSCVCMLSIVEHGYLYLHVTFDAGELHKERTDNIDADLKLMLNNPQSTDPLFLLNLPVLLYFACSIKMT